MSKLSFLLADKDRSIFRPGRFEEISYCKNISIYLPVSHTKTDSKAYELVVSVTSEIVESSFYDGADEDNEASKIILHMSLPLGEGPKSRTISFLESKWL